MRHDTGHEHKVYECEHGHLFDSNTKGQAYVVRCGSKIDICKICGGKLREVKENEENDSN